MRHGGSAIGLACLIAGNILLVLATSGVAWAWLHAELRSFSHLAGLVAALVIATTLVVVGYRSMSSGSDLADGGSGFARFFERTDIGIWEMDWSALAGGGASGFDAGAVVRTVAVNPAGAAMADRLMTGRNAGSHALPLPLDDAVVSAAIRAYLAGVSAFEIEAELSDPDGDGVQLILALSFPQGRPGSGSVVMSVVDISLYATRDKAMKVAHGALAHASRLSTMGALTASVTDAFSQPLSAVLMSGKASLRWLRMETANLGEVESSIENILGAATSAADIVRRTRTFMGPGGGALEAINMAILLDEVMQFLNRAMAIGTIALRREISAHLPEVTGDRVQLQQVLINLMMNAIDALNEKEEGVRILTVAARPHADCEVLVSVADTADGIKPAFVDRIFEPLFTTKTDAVGIGLTICRNTIDAHGGVIWVDSEPGLGSTFKFTLPADGNGEHGPVADG